MRKLWNWLSRLFGRKPAPAPAPAEPRWTFTTDFTAKAELPAGWKISTWTAPGKGPVHSGHWLLGNVSFDRRGVCLKLDQRQASDGSFISSGAEIYTEQKFGYGTYEWEVQASADANGQPVSGSITGIFIYADQATTEIDFEVEGNERHHLTQCTSWVHEGQPNQHTKVEPPAFNHLPHQQFCRYRFVWSPTRIEFYRDGERVAVHTKVVPSGPAAVMLNHWGTHSIHWGGTATIEHPRYMYIKSFKYAPLE